MVITTSTVRGEWWTTWLACDVDAGVRVEIHADYGHLTRIRMDTPNLHIDGDYLEVLRLVLPPKGGTLEDLARNLAHIARGVC